MEWCSQKMATYFLPTCLLLLLLLSRFSRVWLCVTPQTPAHQALPSLGLSRREHWSGLPFPSAMHESEKWKWSHSVESVSSQPHGLQATRLLRPWDCPGKSTRVGCHFLLRPTCQVPLKSEPETKTYLQVVYLRMWPQRAGVREKTRRRKGSQEKDLWLRWPRHGQ